jgi:hypothetical protein
MKMCQKKIITQIGSLPFDDVSTAVEYSLCHDIPFLPELPVLGDAMLEYIKNPGNMSCLDTFRRKTKGREIVKVQCVGPATLVLSGYDENEAVERAYQHISAITDGLEVGELVIFLDEPALGQAGFDYQKLWSPIFDSFQAKFGVHVCGNMNWDELFNSQVDIISFDASQYDITRYPHYRNGKRISWGIKEQKNVRDFQDGDLLTLPCGMGPKFHTAEDCKAALKNLMEISQSLQAVGMNK